jgi:hypothetical protein
MATIRIPSSALEILPFCTRHGEPHSQTCFDTYAHLIITAATMGFHKGGNVRTERCRSFLNQPGPIDLSIFRSQNLMSQMMAMGIVCLPTPEDSIDENQIAPLIEDLAHTGLLQMEFLLRKDGISGFPWNLASWIADPPPADQGLI